MEVDLFVQKDDVFGGRNTERERDGAKGGERGTSSVPVPNSTSLHLLNSFTDIHPDFDSSNIVPLDRLRHSVMIVVER